MKWQKHARLAVAIFGIAFAAVVYFAIEEREAPKEAPAVVRVDAAALLEAAGCEINRVSGVRQDFKVTCDRQLAYEDGTSKLFGVRIDVRERHGRDFVITGDEAVANDKSREITLSGGVTLTASDGFRLTSASASFRESDGIVRAPGEVSFGRGQMTGRGVGMTYDRTADVLTIAENAVVSFVDEAGASTGEFTAGRATLDRAEDHLVLDGSVHAVRGAQTIDADRAKANLTEQEEAITSIELRGSARVAGGSAGFDAMHARDIDLEYAGDGETLERVVLAGQAAIGLKNPSGAPGRQMIGELLTMTLAPDGSLTSAVGRDGVQLTLPGAEGTPSREVRARTLDATGEPGRGMTTASFRDDVEFREETGAGAPPRIARSQMLAVALDGDAVNSAVFTGRVRFEEQGLTAAAGEARYQPAKGTLRLEGAEGGQAPSVKDDRITIEADAIEVTLEGRSMAAAGNVKTRLDASSTSPGLLNREQPANVSARRLQYEGKAQRAVYSGAAQLWQGDTAIRAERLTIDEAAGNLHASGSARSTLSLDGSTSIGRAENIRYDDASRQIAYEGIAPPVGTVSKTPPVTVPAGVPAQLSGPQGDLTATRIVVVLAAGESRMDRLEAYGAVTLRLDSRVATGAGLTYHAEGERYVMAGAPAAPVRIVEPCRETTGKTLAFFKSSDRIVVDGNEEIRTRTTSGGSCPDPPPVR